MSCGNCVAHVTKALKNIEGVNTVDVDLAGGSARVEHDGASEDALVAAIEEEGYTAKVVF